MTRRGSLAYYFAAIACGCFFIAAAYYAHSVWMFGWGERWARDFLFAYFLSLLGGFFATLLFAFVLRRAMRALRCAAAWQWLAGGAVLGAAVLWGLARLGYLLESIRFPLERQLLKSILMIPLIGPVMFSASPFWLPPLAFAATAWVLHRIHRAFEPPGA
jgi:hypothetical protein